MRLAAGARLLLVLVLVLGVAGCQVAPPEGAYFDVDRHPFGAIPANLGFYTGAYVVAPPLYILFLPFVILADVITAPVALMGREGQRTWEKNAEARGPTQVSERMGIFLGSILGAPFHLVALPFGRRGGDDEPASLDAPAPGGDPRYDDTPTAVPRDYPWPPKPSR